MTARGTSREVPRACVHGMRVRAWGADMPEQRKCWGCCCMCCAPMNQRQLSRACLCCKKAGLLFVAVLVTETSAFNAFSVLPAGRQSQVRSYHSEGALAVSVAVAVSRAALLPHSSAKSKRAPRPHGDVRPVATGRPYTRSAGRASAAGDASASAPAPAHAPAPTAQYSSQRASIAARASLPSGVK